MQTSMNFNGSQTMKVLSGMLVVIQFGLFFAILYLGALVTTNMIGLLTQLSGLIIYILAYISFNQKYFSFLPLPKKGAYIIMHGPYSFLRHPVFGNAVNYCSANCRIFQSYYSCYTSLFHCGNCYFGVH